MSYHNPKLSEVQEAQNDAERTRDLYLNLKSKGWKYSSSHLKDLGFWLWAKVIDGKTVVTNERTALALESCLDESLDESEAVDD